MLDFYCPAAGLAVELDGAGHFTPAGAAADETRTAALNQAGIHVIRFENQAVFGGLESVLEAIRQALIASKPG